MASVDDIPTAHTPPGGYGDEMPPPILAGCDEPLAEGAPDLRGTWRVADASVSHGHPVWHHVERIEQAGARVVVTAGGVIHDMIADGTYENGVNDVAAIDFTTPISVAASFEDSVLVLRPQGMPGVEVRRSREGDRLVWEYHGAFTAVLERVDMETEGSHG